MCLDLAVPFLSDDAIIVIDDSNYEHVRQANRDFLVCRPEFRLVFDAYTETHPANMPEPARDLAARGWWNGVNVLVRDSSIAPTYPPVAPTREQFLFDHRVHSSSATVFLASVLGIAENLIAAETSPRAAARTFLDLVRARWQSRGNLPKYRVRNTHSDGLPSSRLHPDLA
jgi:hypothetical protein